MESWDQDSAFDDWLARNHTGSRLRLGLSFSNLCVHGFVSTAQFQPTALSYALALPRLAWRLLARRADQRVQILRDVNGLVRGGEMLLVLGRPGSGCTTMLKALAADTHGIHIGPESKLNYEGIPFQRMRRDFRGESIYVAELDVHFPELTLGQTLTFAASSRETAPERDSLSRRTARDLALLLGLDGSFDTWMGNSMMRGVSGGEKRRTSIAEALTRGSQLQCWDNSTRGLDSETARRFVGLLREYTSAVQTTVVMSMYQASETIYNEFDKVTLLYEGRQIYFGPAQAAADFFHELGFARPARATTPDFLTSLTNPAERVVRRGFEARVPTSPDDFARAWKTSSRSRQLRSEIDAFDSRHPLLAAKSAEDRAAWHERLRLRTSTYAIPIRLQMLICLRRGIQRLRNQPVPVLGAVGANAILAVVVGSVYLNLAQDSRSMDKRAVLIFFSLLVTAFSPAFEVLTIWAQRPIVEKHDRYAFYHSFADAAASMVCDLPNKLTTAALYNVTIYFMVNLRRTPAAFFTWFLFNFVLVLNMSMWFRFIGSLSRTMEQTTAPTCILVLLSCAYAGFVIPIPYMVGWLQWFRRVNPIAYAYESLMINEFQNRDFPCSSMIPAGPSYNMSDVSGKICPVVGAVPGQPHVQGNAYLAQKFSYVPNHMWRNLPIILAMTVIVCVLHLLAAEYIPAERSRGDILRFQRGHGRQRKAAVDSEAAAPTAFAQHLHSDAEKSTRRDDGQTGAPVHGIHKQSSVFSWHGLSYEVKSQGARKKILHGIDGWVRPGTLTAVMGVTGAGKTSLLDVLADRARAGTTGGDICIDGLPRDASFQRRIGYAQQEDIHLATATVREALEFSALLRQAGAESVEDKLAYVDNIIDILDMSAYADAIVGVSGDGLNIEQRKRLTIGVELVAKPELLLFLDEPTSGLDSQTAWSICVLLRKLADNGQAVLCTIHQPSSQLFRMFDRVLLLNEHGETIYFGDIGPDALTLISYFEAYGAPKCKPDANPAEWMLHLTGGTQSQGWAQTWDSSHQKQAVLGHLAEINSLPQSAPPAGQPEGEFVASWPRQLAIVTKRIFQDYWRSPVYLYSKLALCAGVALFNGLSFQDTQLNIQGITNIIFSVFLHTQMFGTIDQQVIPRFMSGRALFETRERQSKSYSWTVFLISNMLVELLWQTLAALLVFVAWYYPTGLWRAGDASFGTAERGALSFMAILFFCLWIITFSQAVAAAVEHAETAVQLATLMFWFSLVFCGIIVSPSDLPRFWIFVYRASPLTYFANGLVSASLANTRATCSAVEVLTVSPSGGGTCGDYLAPYVQQAGGSLLNPEASADCQYCGISDVNSFLDTLGISPWHPWNNIGYLAAFILFNMLATFAFYFVARVPRRT